MLTAATAVAFTANAAANYSYYSYFTFIAPAVFNPAPTAGVITVVTTCTETSSSSARVHQ